MKQVWLGLDCERSVCHRLKKLRKVCAVADELRTAYSCRCRGSEDWEKEGGLQILDLVLK